MPAESITAAPPVQDTRLSKRDELPAWYPPWAKSIADLYFSRTTSVFVLHGNTYDLIPLSDVDAASRAEFGTIPEFLAEQLFGRWDLVLHYDLGRGLRVFAGRNEKRLKEMVALATRRIGDLSTVKNDPGIVFTLLDLFVRENIMSVPEKQLSVAVMVSHASYLFPAGEPGHLSASASSTAVTLLNWATSTHVKSLEMAFVLIDERRTDLSDRITGNPYIATIEVPLPSEPERLSFARDIAIATDGWKRGIGLHAGAARNAQRRNVAQRSVGAHQVRARRPAASRLDALPRDEKAFDRATVPGSARVHRAEMEARHGHRT